MNWVYISVLLSALHAVSLTYVPPSPNLEHNFEEFCPWDSVSVEGVCKCNHEVCIKPPCLTTLNITSNYTDTPGSCCPLYSCDGCQKEAEIDGKCPCAPEAVINSKGKCECVDPHKTLVKDNVCECDLNKCELPHLCDDKSVPVKEKIGCCVQIKCIKCPEDSYAVSYQTPDVEDSCVCNVCPKKMCNENQTPVILRHGKTLPGMCCDLYECRNKLENKTCIINGTEYYEDQTWRSQGGDECKCRNGISFCSHINDTFGSHLNKNEIFRSCLIERRIYSHLQTWLEDPCTNCTCYDGESKCIAHMCDIDTDQVKPSDCPPLSTCKKMCEHGFKLNKHGCEICKCKSSDKSGGQATKYGQFNQFDSFLKEHNLTVDDAYRLINQSLLGHPDMITETTTRSSTTTSTTSTTAESVAKPTAPSSTAVNYSNCGAIWWILISAVSMLLTGIAVGYIVAKKCTTNKYKPVNKKSMNGNCNMSVTFPLTATEKQSFKQKKNII